MMRSSENVNFPTNFVAVQYLREIQVELNFKTINQIKFDVVLTVHRRYYVEIKFVCWMLKFLKRLPSVIVHV
jgi:hypothetical protein